MLALDERPNILLILTDQQRFDTLGCYGAPICRTPHIDALAERGVRFTSAYTAAIACSPSRAMLFTGVYPHKNGVLVNNLALDHTIPNLASELGRAGYWLGYSGKWHVDHAWVPSRHGFTGLDFPGYGYPPADGSVEGLNYHRRAVTNGRYVATPHYVNYLKSHGYPRPRVLHAKYGNSPQMASHQHEIYGLLSGDLGSSFEAMVSEQTVRLIRQARTRRRETGAPFFIWANFWGPHTPCVVPEPYYSMYDPAQIPEEPSFCETFDHKPPRQKRWEDNWGLSGDAWLGWSEIVARYWGYVTMLDDLVGRILEEVRALGLDDNTLILFSSDHDDY